MSPPSFDPRTPSPARRYDHWLGGKDNFGADRNSADQIRQKFPDIPVAAKENRLFVLRAVTYLAQAGVRQFLDIGFGLPEPPNVHEVAQEVAPDSRVVYVDNDVEVVTHARGRMTSAPDGAIGVMHADLRTPVEILADPAVRDTLDLTEPVAVLLCAVLHFLPDTDRPHEVVDWLRRQLAPGSYLVVSHATTDLLPPETLAGLAELSEEEHGPFQARTKDEIAAFLAGLDVVDPGLVPTVLWRPHGRWRPDPSASPRQAAAYAAVGHLPRPTNR